jgi:hypothetical protein
VSDRFTHDAAPYVLGALPPEDRRAFEAHLAACPACEAAVREFAGLPGLLSRLPAAEVPAVLEGDDPAPRPSLIPSLLVRARRERRARRRRAVAAGAAAAGLAALGTGLAVDRVADPPAAEPALAFTKVVDRVPATASASLSDVPGGTRIAMTCTYEGKLDGRTRAYTLRVVREGDPKPMLVGEWPVLSTEPYRVEAVAPVPREAIDRVEVTNASGDVLLVLTP